MKRNFSCFDVALEGMVKLNVTFFVSSTPSPIISNTSLIFRFALYAIASTLSSWVFPRLIISAVYSTFSPDVMFVGPFTFFTIMIFSSSFIWIVVSSENEVAFRLVHMVPLFSSVNFA